MTVTALRRPDADLDREQALVDRAAHVVARLNEANAALVALAADVVAQGRWADGGYRSPAHWLVVHTGTSAARAREVVEVARRLPELPAVAQHVQDGRLTLEQTVVVVRHTPVAHQRAVADLAPHATVPQLQRLLGRYAFDVPDERPQSEEPRPTRAERADRPAGLRMRYDDGRFLLSFDAPADQGALVEQALREAKDARFTAGDAEASYGDALVEIASRSLASVGSPSRRAHYRVHVHVDAGSPAGWLNGAGAITPAMASRLGCDAVAAVVREVDGLPVSVGREQRIVPERTRRLVEDRDRGCRVPGCPVGGTGHLEVHHLVPWAQGGRTDLGTNVALCPHHHRDVHAGRLRLSGDPSLAPGTAGGLRVTNHAGIELRPPQRSAAAPRGGVLPRASTPPTAAAWSPPTGEPVDSRWVLLRPDDELARRRRPPPAG